MYTAKDGRSFSNDQRGRLYDRSLADKGADDAADAPGGYEWDHNIKQHGPVLETRIKFDGPGRWRHIAIHADGARSESVHPERHRAHQVSGNYLEIEPPPAISTHQRARSQPTGPKEEQRVAREDHRETEREE